MNLAFIHFHLDRGGVSQVIANQLRALDTAAHDIERVALLYGRPRSSWTEGIVDELKAATASAKEVEVEFGINIGGKTGVILVEGTAAANLKVTVKW